MFAPAAFLALLMLWFGHRGRWLPFAVVAAIALYTYYYSLFVLAPVGLWALWRRQIRGYALAVVGAGVLYLPWLPVLLGRTRAWESPWTPPTSPGRVLQWTWPTLLTGIPDPTVWALPWQGPALAAVAVALAVLLARRRDGLLYVAAAGLVPLLLIAAVALVRAIYHPRYAVPAAPGLYLAIAGALALSGRWLMPLRAVLALSVVALFGWGLWRYADGDGLTRDNYRDAVAWVNAAQQPGDAALYNAPPGFQYYYRGDMPHAEIPRGGYGEEAAVGQLAELARGRSRFWHLTHELRPSDPEGFVQAQLHRRARLLERRDFGQVDVALYELSSDNRIAPLPRRDVGPLRIGHALELIAVGVDDRAHPSGGPVPVTLHWLVKAPIGADLGVWVQLEDEQGFRWGRGDRQPRDAEFRLSSAWPVGARVTTGHSVPMPPGTPPGSYRLSVGAYRLGDGLRALEVKDPAGRPLGESALVGPVLVGRAAPTGSPAGIGGPRGRIDDAVELMGSTFSASGLDGETRRMPVGSTLGATLLWRVEQAPGPREIVLRILGPGGAVAHETRLPTGGGRYPASQWVAGDVVADQVRLVVPPALPAGEYRLWAGLAPPGGTPRGVELLPVAVGGIARTFERPQIARPLDVRFDDGVVLAGYAVEPDALVLYWHPTATPRRDYKVFNHVLDAAGAIVAQRDAVPADWTRPTTGWLPGEYVVDRHPIAVPPGAATVRVGLYDPISGERLPPGYVDLAP